MVMRRHRGERGATLLILAMVVFIFLSAAVMLASSQITHSTRVMAEYGKLQAMNAAEAGIFASFAATASLGPTTLATGDPLVLYEADVSGPAPSFWITSTGSAALAGFTYRSRARAFVNDGRILQWEFE